MVLCNIYTLAFLYICSIKFDIMKLLLLFISIILISAALSAQTLIKGTVKTAKGEAIHGANISVKNSYDGASSDSTGHFHFTTSETGKQIIQFSSLGFGSDSVVVQINGKSIELQLVLKEKFNELDAVVITAGTFEASDSKKGVVLSSLDVATTAGAEADVFAALQTLPGTQTSFAENGLFVRGGSAAETKTYFDGMLVKNPFNTQLPDLASRGRFSPFMFKGTTFSAGGYSAQYGQALSSALILESKDLPEKTTTGISLMTVGGGLDHTQRYKNSALSIGGNYINLKPAFAIFKQHTNWDKEPEDYGGTIQYKLKTSATGMFKVYSELSSGKVGLFTDDLNNLPKENYFSNNNRNTYVNSTYQDYLSDKWKIQGGASFSNNRDSGKIEVDQYTRTDQLMQARLTLTNYFGNLSTLRFGVETSNTKRKESFNTLSRDYTDETSATFAESDIFFTERLVARVGIRSEYSSYMDEFNIAPRTSLGYKTGKFSQVSMAYGRFYQNPEDEYLVQTPALDFERADHYILNFQRINSGQVFRVEGYYKDYKNLTKSVGNLLNNSGNGYADGVDVFWRDKKTFKGIDYWISYSYLDTKRNFRDYPISSVPPFAAKHTLNLVYKQYVPQLKSQIGATYTYATGRTYFNPNNLIYLGDKTKEYQNFSVNVSYLTHLFKQFTVIYASVNNIPGFKNIYGYHYSDNGQARKAIEPPARRNFFLGMFITIGDNTFVQ